MGFLKNELAVKAWTNNFILFKRDMCIICVHIYIVLETAPLILVCKYHLPLKGIRAVRENDRFQSCVKISLEILLCQKMRRYSKSKGVSQKEKNNYRMLMHMYGILRSSTDKPICRARIET